MHPAQIIFAAIRLHLISHIIPSAASFDKEMNLPLNVQAGDGRITMFAKKKVEENYS